MDRVQITPELEIEIQNFINKRDFTWTVGDVKEQYEKYKQGEYVSFTARLIINNVIEKNR